MLRRGHRDDLDANGDQLRLTRARLRRREIVLVAPTRLDRADELALELREARRRWPRCRRVDPDEPHFHLGGQQTRRSIQLRIDTTAAASEVEPLFALRSRLRRGLASGCLSQHSGSCAFVDTRVATTGCRVSRLPRIGFERRLTGRSRTLPIRRAPALGHVRQFMRDEPRAASTPRRVLAGAKDDVIVGGIRGRIETERRGRGMLIGVDAHVTEVMTEAAFHGSADGRIERPTRSPCHGVRRRHCARASSLRRTHHIGCALGFRLQGAGAHRPPLPPRALRPTPHRGITPAESFRSSAAPRSPNDTSRCRRSSLSPSAAEPPAKSFSHS